MSSVPVISRQSAEATRLLGALIAQGRRERRWTSAELAERAGVSRATVSKAEHGDPSVRIGVVFELATLVGVPLFDMSNERLSSELRRNDDRLTLMPQRIRPSTKKVADEF